MFSAFHSSTITQQTDFAKRAFDLFQKQWQGNPVYREFAHHLGLQYQNIETLTDLPFLPVEFFKTHAIKTGAYTPETCFYSSGTTDQVKATHYVKDLAHYHQTALAGFQKAYTDPQKMAILGLLPSYLENPNASLVSMVRHFIELSEYPESGFFMHDLAGLKARLTELEQQAVPTLLIGVSFALLDFAEHYPMPLHHTTLMETGGMKGRRREMIRQELHDTLKEAFALKHIHAEYGMTELLSQAYAPRGGLFITPPWMKVLPRDPYDPFQVTTSGRGALNIIDLANYHSCAFLATQDLGTVYEDGSFEVSGRFDHSDVRGCNLMAL